VRAATATADWSSRAAAASSPADQSAAGRPRLWMGIAAAFAIAATAATAWGVSLARDRARLDRDLTAARRDADAVPDLQARLRDAALRLAAVDAERRMALNTPIVDLVPAATRSDASTARLRLAPETTLITVIVALPAGTPVGTPLAIEIFDPAGASLGRWSGLAASALGTCTFTVAASALPSGTLRFSVSRDVAPPALVHEYRLEVAR
jgi:hypothetical protein